MLIRTWILTVLPAAFGLFFIGCEKQLPESHPSAPTETTEKETAMPVTVQWFGHASFRLSTGDTVIYIDPWKLSDAPHNGSLVLVSHSHHDHYSADDIGEVAGDGTEIIASADVIKKHGSGRAIKPGQTIEAAGVRVTAVAAYNPAKQFHPKANNWVGFVVEIGGKRIYYAGDTDETPELKALTNIDLALLPVGGTYTMNAQEAATAVSHFQPKQALPYHWGDIVGSRKDAEQFKKQASCQVTVLDPGGSMTL